MRPAKPLLERFERQMIPEPMSGCWLWFGAVDAAGYGQIKDSAHRQLKAHRAAWMLFVGALPADRMVCHRCDTPACVNPAHLFLGTAADNNRDRDRKGRGIKGDHVPPERRARGERSGMSRLSDVDTERLRADIEAAQVTRAELARRYGISAQLVSAIALGQVRRRS